MKMIAFSIRGEIAQLSSSSLTTMKLWVSSPPYIKVQWDTLSAAEKVGILNNAFAGSQTGLSMPKDPQEHSKSILKELGFSSWKKFYGEGRHCSIQLDPERKQYCFTPMIYLKENNSLYGIKDGIVCVSSEVSSEEMISTLDKVIESIPKLAELYYSNQ